MMKSRSFRTMEDDDDFPAYYHHYARNSQPPRTTVKPITWLLTVIFSLLEAATRSSLGTVVMAIFVVAVIQFRANIMYSLQSFRERIRGLGPWGIIMEVWYTLRAFAIMCWQRLGYFWTSSKERTTAILEGSNGGSGVTSRGGVSGGGVGSGPVGAIRRRTNALPELEEPHPRPKNGMTTTTTTPRIFPQPTEPSFRNEADYPPGWLVFHPVLGVIEKTKADEYDMANQQLHQRKERKDLKKPAGGAVTEDEKKEECARLPATR